MSKKSKIVEIPNVYKKQENTRTIKFNNKLLFIISFDQRIVSVTNLHLEHLFQLSFKDMREIYDYITEEAFMYEMSLEEPPEELKY